MSRQRCLPSTMMVRNVIGSLMTSMLSLDHCVSCSFVICTDPVPAIVQTINMLGLSSITKGWALKRCWKWATMGYLTCRTYWYRASGLLTILCIEQLLLPACSFSCISTSRLQAGYASFWQVWGGAGTRMNCDPEQFLRRWTPLLQRSSQ